MLSKNTINKVFTILHALNPEPKIELKYTSPFTLMVAVILSAQSTDKMVNHVTAPLFEKYSTPETLLSLGFDGLRNYIKKIGLSNSKAKNILKTCEILVHKYNSQVPDSYKELIKLPGIGRKSADVILNSAFNKPTIAVDRHVFRVVNRLGIIKNNSIDKVASELLTVIPKKWHLHAHHWLVLHGRYICKAPKPLCAACPISHLCLFYNEKKKNNAQNVPAKQLKASVN